MHFRRKEGILCTSPVIMMKKSFDRRNFCHDRLCILKFNFCNKLNELMHCFRLFVHTDHGIFHTHHSMKSFKNTLWCKCACILVFKVCFSSPSIQHSPVSRVVRNKRFMGDDVLPLCDIIHQLMLSVMYRERTHLAFRESP